MSAVRSKVSLNSSRPLHAFPREGTFLDESPALTAVLQAQPRRIVPSAAAGWVGTGGRGALALNQSVVRALGSRRAGAAGAQCR